MILDSIFRGEFSPIEQICPTNPEYHLLTAEIADMLDTLISNITSENREILEAILEKIQETQIIECETFYCSGFAEGILLQQEIQHSYYGIVE